MRLTMAGCPAGLAILTAALGLLPAATALAHPHIWVDAAAELTFDAQGRLAEIRHAWTFDESYSDFAIEGLDVNRDGKISDAEFAPLIALQAEFFAEYKYFTIAKNGADEIAFGKPATYQMHYANKRLTVAFALPVEKPVKIGKSASVEIADPDFYVAFTLLPKVPVKMTRAPAGCTAEHAKPQQEQQGAAAWLRTLPGGKDLQLPPDLTGALAGTAGRFTIACR